MRGRFTTLVIVLGFAIPALGQTQASRIPRMPDGKPNLTGLWQALGTAYWDIRDHSAQAGPFYQLGAIGAIPGGPEVKCYMPGVPRATYMPYPFQIIQSQNDIAIAYEYATSNRVINMGKGREAAVDTWMGTSNGHWEGDTLVVDVTGLNGQSWFDRSGNFMTENVHIVERYTLADADHISYEATIDDSTIFTRPWKISLPLYRRKEQNAQLGEFKCVEFAEELIYGHLRKR